MTEVAEMVREIEPLRDSLSKISEVNLRINESLDCDTVMHEVLESARLLTEARYGVTVTLDRAKRVEDFLSSGLASEESRWLQEMPEGAEVL